MDSINLTNPPAPAALPAARPSASRSAQPDYKSFAQGDAETPISVDKVDAARLKALETASAEFANTYFTVSDVKFSIFKDKSGEYITRFTSLKDGSVTYYPEPDIFALLGKPYDPVFSQEI